MEGMMPQSYEENARDEDNQKTIAELVFFVDDPRIRRELERFRIRFEREFGETDLTKRYTSTWPEDQQKWMMQHHLTRYWDGLPPFVQAYFRDKMSSVHRSGKLDDAPELCLKLYASGKMKVPDDGRQR
jgi:hypothetical protein